MTSVLARKIKDTAPRTPGGGQWYVGKQPLKVERQGEIMELEPGDAIPEIWDTSVRSQKLQEARGRIVFRSNPSPPTELVEALVEALSATKTGAEKAEKILDRFGLTSPADLALPSVDPEIRAAWDERVGAARARAALLEKRSKAKVVPTDVTAYQRLHRARRDELVAMVADQGADAVETHRTTLGLPGEPGEWPKTGLADAAALSTGVAVVEYAPEP